MAKKITLVVSNKHADAAAYAEENGLDSKTTHILGGDKHQFKGVTPDKLVIVGPIESELAKAVAAFRTQRSGVEVVHAP